MGFLRLWRPWGFSHEARRGPQGASRAAPGNSCLHAHGEGELVITLESWEMTRASRRVEEGLSRSFSGGGGKPSFPSTSAGDYRELPRVPLRGEGCCVVGRASRDSAGFGAMEEGLIFRRGGNHVVFSRVAAGFSSYDGDLRLPLGLALGSPIFPSSCEGKLGDALESLQGRRDLT